MPYTQRKYFNFDRESTPSNLSEEDVITTINFPLVVRHARIVDWRMNWCVLKPMVLSTFHFQNA